MRKYMIRRILFSIFSLLVVIMLVMLLVYSLIERSVIFQTDDTWNKKSNNDRVYYEYTQYQKYGYLTFVDYTAFLKNKYQALVGDNYTTDHDYIVDKNAILTRRPIWTTPPSGSSWKSTPRRATPSVSWRP